ncbi:SMI1/KNR4 family protein [bacterium]|nr:SMI1/KNR4 family protein [bacterium]
MIFNDKFSYNGIDIDIPQNYYIEFVKDVTIEHLKEAESYIGVNLPPKYKDYLLKNGRFRVIKKDSDYPYFEFLHPKESIAQIQYEKDNFDETCFGDEPSEIQAAYNELAVRERLYPFQYCSSYVKDFWCLFLGASIDESFYIADVFHDDYELFGYFSESPIIWNEFNNYSFESYLIYNYLLVKDFFAKER